MQKTCVSFKFLNHKATFTASPYNSGELNIAMFPNWFRVPTHASNKQNS